MKYLDEIYTDIPPVCFDGIEEYDNILSAYKMSELRHMDRFLVPLIHDKILNPRNCEYFRHTREKIFHQMIEDIESRGEVRTSLLNEIRSSHNIDSWFLAGPFAGR